MCGSRFGAAKLGSFEVENRVADQCHLVMMLSCHYTLTFTPRKFIFPYNVVDFSPETVAR